jgi:hypothetical protein
MMQNKSDDFMLIDGIVSRNWEKTLAQISERENYALKNRYRFQKTTMDFADPKKMPIDESKVKDLLRNQHVFRDKMN